MNQTTGWFRKNKYWTRLSGARGLAFLSACTGLWVVHGAPIPIQVTDAAWRCGHGYGVAVTDMNMNLAIQSHSQLMDNEKWPQVQAG